VADIIFIGNGSFCRDYRQICNNRSRTNIILKKIIIKPIHTRREKNRKNLHTHTHKHTHTHTHIHTCYAYTRARVFVLSSSFCFTFTFYFFLPMTNTAAAASIANCCDLLMQLASCRRSSSIIIIYDIPARTYNIYELNVYILYNSVNSVYIMCTLVDTYSSCTTFYTRFSDTIQTYIYYNNIASYKQDDADIKYLLFDSEV